MPPPPPKFDDQSDFGTNDRFTSMQVEVSILKGWQQIMGGSKYESIGLQKIWLLFHLQ